MMIAVPGSIWQDYIFEGALTGQEIKTAIREVGRIVAKPGTGTQTASLQAQFEQAVALREQGNFKGAVKSFKRILKQVPDQPQVLNVCALCLAELGDLQSAVNMLDKAIKNTPGFTDSWVNLGVIRQKSGNLDAAAHAYDQYRRLTPGSALGHLNFANVCQLQKRYDDAAVAYEQALAIAPDNPGAWSNLSRASLHLGDWEKSADAADRTLKLWPGHTGALAIKSVALAELGRTAEVSGLVDFDRLIEKRDFSAPEGYDDLASFNQALCDHCLNHPSLVYEPGENTTMKGHQTGNLSRARDLGPIGPLLAMIENAVHEYQASHPPDPAHPFLTRQPKHWNYDIWGTVLGSQGHQASHIHRSGWLSGCYYARIPDVITAGDEGHAGWIEFGRPQDYPLARAEPEVRSYQPHEGMVVLFPSYFYHRTEPFVSTNNRISIAFDILPKN